jgi:uncharacterized protein involved in exopolysaccharide biosynthesis
VAPPAGLPRLVDYPRFVRRHRWPIALMVAAGLALGTLWSSTSPPAYSATASIVLVPVPKYVIPATAGLLPPEVSIDTDAQLLRSPAVLAAIGEELGIDPTLAEERIGVGAAANSHVLHLTVSAGSAEAAARAANAAATAFVGVRKRKLGALASEQLRQLRLYVSDQEELLAREQNRRMVITGQDEMFEEILVLQAGLEELEEARREPAQVVRPAEPPRWADHANTEVPVTSGAMLGMLGGCLVGAVGDRRRRLTHLNPIPRSSSTRAEDTDDD